MTALFRRWRFPCAILGLVFALLPIVLAAVAFTVVLMVLPEASADMLAAPALLAISLFLTAFCVAAAITRNIPGNITVPVERVSDGNATSGLRAGATPAYPIGRSFTFRPPLFQHGEASAGCTGR